VSVISLVQACTNPRGYKPVYFLGRLYNLTFSWGWISRKFFISVMRWLIYPRVRKEMDAFDIRRVQLAESSTADSCKDWYLLNSKICVIPVSKFMSRSPLVKNKNKKKTPDVKLEQSMN